MLPVALKVSGASAEAAGKAHDKSPISAKPAVKNETDFVPWVLAEMFFIDLSSVGCGACIVKDVEVNHGIESP